MGVHRLQAAVYHAMASSSEAAAPPAGAQAIPARPGTETELAAIRDLAITPGGLHFLGTTPGGTRIIYDRNTLMHYKQSPLSQTPPAGLPVIPGVTAPGDPIAEEGEDFCSDDETPTAPSLAPNLAVEEADGDGDDAVFPME